METKLVRKALLDLRDRVEALEVSAPSIDLDGARSGGKIRIPHQGGWVTLDVDWLRRVCDPMIEGRNATWDAIESEPKGEEDA